MATEIDILREFRVILFWPDLCQISTGDGICTSRKQIQYEVILYSCMTCSTGAKQ